MAHTIHGALRVVSYATPRRCLQTTWQPIGRNAPANLRVKPHALGGPGLPSLVRHLTVNIEESQDASSTESVKDESSTEAVNDDSNTEAVKDDSSAPRWQLRYCTEAAKTAKKAARKEFLKLSAEELRTKYPCKWERRMLLERGEDWYKTLTPQEKCDHGQIANKRRRHLATRGLEGLAEDARLADAIPRQREEMARKKRAREEFREGLKAEYGDKWTDVHWELKKISHWGQCEKNHAKQRLKPQRSGEWEAAYREEKERITLQKQEKIKEVLEVYKRKL